MRASKLCFLVACASLTCAVQAENIDPKNVQVHERYTNIVADCKKIGPLNKIYSPGFFDTYLTNISTAVIKMAQIDAAKMGGDTLVVVRLTPELFGAQGNFQGIVMQCFSSIKNNDQEKIIGELTKKSEQGDAVALVNLAYRYLQGHDVEQSFKRAYELYMSAAKLGDQNSMMAINAQLNLGNIWESGLIGEKNLEKALMWYFLAGVVENDESNRRIANIKKKMSELQIENSKKMMKICMVNNTEGCDLSFGPDWKVCEVVKAEGSVGIDKRYFEKLDLGVVFNSKFGSGNAKAFLIEKNGIMNIDFEINEKSSSTDAGNYIEYKSKSGWGNIKENVALAEMVLKFGKNDSENITLHTKCH